MRGLCEDISFKGLFPRQKLYQFLVIYVSRAGSIICLFVFAGSAMISTSFQVSSLVSVQAGTSFALGSFRVFGFGVGVRGTLTFRLVLKRPAFAPILCFDVDRHHQNLNEPRSRKPVVHDNHLSSTFDIDSMDHMSR